MPELAVVVCQNVCHEKSDNNIRATGIVGSIRNSFVPNVKIPVKIRQYNHMSTRSQWAGDRYSKTNEKLQQTSLRGIVFPMP